MVNSSSNHAAVLALAKLGSTLTVKEFGAVGDGDADDTVKIQAAIDAVADAGGGQVFFPRGVYRISDSLILKSDVTLQGEGNQISRIVASSLEVALIRPEHTSFNHSIGGRQFRIFIRDLGIDNETVSVGSIGIDLSQCSLSGVSNVRVRLCATGIRIANVAYYNSVSGGEVSNCLEAVVVQNGANSNSIEKVRSVACGDVVVLREGPNGAANNINVIAVYAEAFSGRGVWLNGDSMGWLAANNIFGCRFENVGGVGVGVEIGPGGLNNAIAWNKFVDLDATVVDNGTRTMRFDAGGIRSRFRIYQPDTDNSGLLYYNVAATAMFLRNGVDSDYIDLWARHTRLQNPLGRFDGARLRLNGGTDHTEAQYNLAGWGDTASVSVAQATDARGRFTVEALGEGQTTDPTITLTFANGAYFADAPHAVVVRNGGDQPSTPLEWSTTTSSLTITFRGTPVEGESYTFQFLIVG